MSTIVQVLRAQRHMIEMKDQPGHGEQMKIVEELKKLWLQPQSSESPIVR